ncbi:MAG: hypothetical protein RLP09_41075 [Sandaracinaceae bacterium]
MTHSTTVLVPRAPRTSDGEALALQLGALGRRLRACGARLVHLPPPHGRPFLRERLLPWRSASGPRALVFCQDTEDAPVALWHGLASHGFLVTRAPASLAPGDVVRLGDVLLVAHRDAPRGRRFCRALARATRLRVEEVQLDPSFPSLESAVAALPDGALVFAPNAFTPLGRFQLRQLFPRQRHLLVPHGEALAGGLRWTMVGQCCVMAQGTPTIMALVRQRGFEPVVVDAHRVQRFGRGVACVAQAVTSATPLPREAAAPTFAEVELEVDEQTVAYAMAG